MADPRVRPTSPGPPDPGGGFRSDNQSGPARVPSPDDYLLVDRLREDALQGRMDLDSILSEVTHAARYFTDGSGAALALWSQGVVICRARSGDTAPPLGAKLDVESGISGECLRSGRSRRCNDTLTDPLVDGTVCQELGIRSLAAVPLRGEHGIVGILEVFSDHPNAFSDAHLTLLKQLAQIAVTGRSRSVPAASPPLQTRTSVMQEVMEVPEREFGTAPVKPSIVEVVAERMRGEEGRPLRLVAAAVLLLAVLGGFGWMLSRGHASSTHPSQTVQAASNSAGLMAATAATETSLTITPSMDSGRENGRSKRSAATRQKSDADANDLVQRASNSIVTDRGEAPAPVAAPAPATASPASSEEPTAPDSTQLMAGIPNSSAVPASVFDAPVAMPKAALRASQGVTGGHLTHKVSPTYPSQARLQRIEGPVVLDAVVGEDGNVHDIKIVKGEMILAAAAKQAVQQWRYQPFELNGKPVPMHTQITIQFKLP